MTSFDDQSLDQFVKEYGAERKTRIARNHAWQQAHLARQYLYNSSTPGNLTGFFASDPTKRAVDGEDADRGLPFGPVTLERQAELQQQQNQFAEALEEVWTATKGEIPLSWFMQHDLDELRAINAQDLGLNLEALTLRHDILANHLDFQAKLEAEIESRYQAALDGNMFWKRVSANPFANTTSTTEVDRGKIEEEVWLEFTGQRDKIFEEDIATWREAREQELMTSFLHDPANRDERGNLLPGADSPSRNLAVQAQLEQEENMVRAQIVAGGDPGDLLDTRTAFHNIVAGGFSGLAWGMDKLITGAGGMLWAVDGLMALSGSGLDTPYDWVVNRYKENQAEVLAAYEQRAGTPEGQAMLRAAQVGAEQAWHELADQDPDTFQEYLAMADGNVKMAGAFFMADVVEAPKVQEQLSTLVEELEASDRELIEEIREQDFRFSHEVMDLLAMWGRNGPGRLGTAFTLLLSDKDYWDDLTAGRFRDVWNEVGDRASELNFMPSAALGIDGSLIGLGMDFGLGIAFDPTTWAFGPSLSRGVTGAKAADEAARLARSPFVRAMADNIIDFIQSPSRGTGAVGHLTSWLDDIGRAEILDVTGLQTKMLPDRAWARTAEGRNAMEVSTSFLQRLLPNQKVTKATVDVIGKLGDDILERGFQEVVEITISRADNTIHLTDGAKRVLAAGQKGISHVPVRLRVVDDAAAGTIQRLSPHILDDAATKGLPLDLLDKVADVTRTVDSQITTAAGGLEGLADSMRQFGFDAKQPVTVKINRALDQILLDDGNHRLAAARMAGLDRIPTRIVETTEDLSMGRSPKASNPLQKYTDIFPNPVGGGNLTTEGVSLSKILQGKELKRALKDLGKTDEVFMRPDRLLPGETLLGKLDKARISQAIQDSIMRGAKPSEGARRTVMATAMGNKTRDILKRGVPKEVRSLFTKLNTTTRLDLHGPNVIGRALDMVYRLGGDNIAWVDRWTQRLFEHQRHAIAVVKRNETHLATLRPLQAEVQALLDLTGGAWDDAFRFADDSVKQAVNQAKIGDEASQAALRAAKTAKSQSRKNRQQLQVELTEKMRALEKEALRVHAALEKMPDQHVLAKIIEEMMDDFNRTQIVPRWQRQLNRARKNGTLDEIFDAEKQTIRWDYLKKGRLRKGRDLADDAGGFFPDTLKDIAEAAGIKDVEKLYRFLNQIPETPMTANLPLAPLDLLAATTYSGKQWILWTKTAMGNAIREATLSLHKAWVIDKVLRPATAMTVSGDELLRIFHRGGHEAVGRYIADRALFMNGRIQQALHGSRRGGPSAIAPARRQAVREGSRLSPRLRQRLQALDEYTLRAREWERIFYDDHGLGWTDILTDDPLYLDAAKQWTGQMIQQSGFRAFLRGPKAFEDWFLGPDGEAMRHATILSKKGNAKNPSTGVVASAQDAYLGWQTMFEKVILKRAQDMGVFDEVRQAFIDVAKKVDDAGGKAIDLPDWVFQHLGPVRGTAKHARKKMSPLQMTDAFFDRFFLDPVQYRRGFVAELVAKQEKARLEGLFTTQGMRILSDVEVQHALGIKGLGGAAGSPVQGFITEQALKRGMVPQSHIDNLVQSAVDAEIEHMLYIADEGRRIGSIATGTIFPFGKPYADMMGFWGREMLRRPHFRGLIHEDNAFHLSDLVTAGGNFNPRTAALVSRLAHTDFTIDQGFLGGGEEGETGGLIPGSDKTDLSPLLFLPTGGENPFYSLIPGAGYIPMWGLDMLLGALGDPINDPLGYQELVDTIGDVIQGAHFGNPDPALSLAQRVLGGGTFGQMAELAMDAYTLFPGNSGGGFPMVSTVLGQPDREIDRGRTMSAILANPEEWETLLALEDSELIALAIDEMATRADRDAAWANIAEQGSRFLVPATSKFDGRLDDIQDVWITAGDTFPQLGDSRFDLDLATPEERSQYVADVRGRFFDLPQEERDRLITEQPTLAVNLISTWDWTNYAEDLGIEGTELAYRTDGSREGLARHDLYIKRGFIRPLSPQERARRIVGLALSARESTAKRIYEGAASAVNDILWDHVVADQTKVLLDALVNDPEVDLADKLGVRSARELWEAWGSYEDDFEAWFFRLVGVDPDDPNKQVQALVDRIKGNIKVPAKEKAWGTRWPGINPDNLSGRFGNIQLYDDILDENLQQLARASGVKLVSGMTGAQLYNEVQAVVTDVSGPLSAYVDPAYQTYIGERSAAYRVIDEEMSKLGYNPRYNADWGRTVIQFMEYEENTSERYRNAILGIPSEEQVEVQRRFLTLMNTADDHVVADWQQLWDMRYKRSYGPLGWTPPQPLSPFNDDGTAHEGAYQPFIRHVIDGDSLVVADRMDANSLHEVRLLGVRARDYGLDDTGAQDDKDRLWDVLQQALANDDRIYLVRDPKNFGNVDIYGRELAWLWIVDESNEGRPFYFPNEMLPNRDPSGGRRR